MTSVHTIDPQIPQHLVPITLTDLSTLNSQREQLSKPCIGEYEFRPVLGQGRLCSGIRLLTDLQEEVGLGGEGVIQT